MRASVASSRYVCWAENDVDDSDLFKEVLREVAPDYGPKQFINGEVLLEFLAEQDHDYLPGLIIPDLHIPAMNSREALKLLSKEERYNSIAKVVFTTSESQMDTYFCKSMNTEMLTKPTMQWSLCSSILLLCKGPYNFKLNWFAQSCVCTGVTWRTKPLAPVCLAQLFARHVFQQFSGIGKARSLCLRMQLYATF